MSSVTTCTGESRAAGERALREILCLAILRKREAQAFYRRAAILAGEGTKLRQVFMSLEADERSHEQWLVESYAVFQMQRAAEEAIEADLPVPVTEGRAATVECAESGGPQASARAA